ncbi:MAG: hypothetical protein IT357_18465 [Gemmatimonadaceae bacterium]|nr:hypothetical protein [Gemmatimonadaceae bacterium]
MEDQDIRRALAVINRRLDTLHGKILGTQIAVRAVVLASAQMDEVMLSIQTEIDRWHAQLSNTTDASDAFLAGVDDALRHALPAASDVARRPDRE